jgi:hypothetical protein
MSAHLSLVFTTANNDKTMSFRVPRPKMDLTDAQVRNAMATFINSAAFIHPENGVLADLHSARIVEQDLKSYNVAS